MKLKNNKKGFTLVELVIVIAVIAVLAAVLIPTFGAVISNAQKRAVESEASNLKTGILIEYATEGNFDQYCIAMDTSSDENGTAVELGSSIWGTSEAKFSDYISEDTTVTIYKKGEIKVSTDRYYVIITANSISEAEEV